MPSQAKQELLRICVRLAEQKHLKAACKLPEGNRKGSVMAEAGPMWDKFLKGPLGTYIRENTGSHTPFKSIASVIKEDMTPLQRQRLGDRISRALQRIIPNDLLVLLPMILTMTTMKNVVLREITNFITNEMNMIVRRESK